MVKKDADIEESGDCQSPKSLLNHPSKRMINTFSMKTIPGPFPQFLKMEKTHMVHGVNLKPDKLAPGMWRVLSMSVG